MNYLNIRSCCNYLFKMARNAFNSRNNQDVIVREINVPVYEPNNHPSTKYKDRLVLNGYLLTNSLNSGHSGNVFKGIHMKTNKTVAIKCCSKHKNWIREVNALKTMKHENIVALVGIPIPFTRLPCNIRYSMDKDNTVFAHNGPTTSNSMQKRLIRKSKEVHMLGVEYAEYGDLYEILVDINDGVLNENATRYIIKELTKALIYALHEGDNGNGISHRDVKLENIFISKDGTIKLGDWGLCAMNSRERTCVSSCGTLGYMAPEIICKKKYIAEKIDVWSLGIILFSCVFGTRPYSEPKQRMQYEGDCKWKDGWLGAMENERWNLWWLSHGKENVEVQNASQDLKDLIESIFAFNPNERISLLGIACHPWILEKDSKSYTKKDFLKDIGLA